MVLKQCRDHGMPLPESLQNPPKLDAWLEYVFGAFEDLSVSRSIAGTYEGVIEGYIAWKDMYAWCCAEDLSYGESHDVMRLLRAMDVYYVDHCRRKRVSRRSAGRT